MNSVETARLESAYRSEAAPWSALLLAKLHPLLMEPVPDDTRAPFVAANTALSTWWPQHGRPLWEIYSREVASCWLAYERAPDENKELLLALQRSITCAYMQLLVLRRFEERLNEGRRPLPNDLNECGYGDLLATVEAALERLTPDERKAVHQWIAEVGAAPAEKWDEVAARLDAILNERL